MSISDASTRTDFDDWIVGEFAQSGSFTAFVVLVAISEIRVTPLASTYFSVVGDEMTWADMTVLLAGSGKTWSGAAFFAETADDGGPLDNPTARVRLRALESRIDRSRLVMNEGHFFDSFGRRMTIEEVDLQ